MRPLGFIFLPPKGGGNNLTRLMRKNTLDRRKGRFLRLTRGGTPALARLEQPITFAGK
ncbi:hypothetical protein M076_4994 [Bacteroides fragilis str. 2-F-2 |uniref:Uncharacterized protein n=1 Tax=Bacteroides fragilis str. 2-F-2 \|nr:hypothetical protein M078_3979 [Bacteroides fragilis str. 2-F-2 \